jgi:hypothetical protein
LRLHFALIAAALVITAVSGAASAWDGSAYLFHILNFQSPTAVHGRYTGLLLQWPAVLASRFTDSLGILQAVFGLSLVAPTILALAASWYLLPKDAKDLFVWPALSVGLAMLPGQFFLVSEALVAVQFSWAIVLAVLVYLPGPSPRWLLLVVLVVAVFFLHPVAGPILAMAALIAACLPLVQGAPRRRLFPVAVGLGALAGLQLLMVRDDPGFRDVTLQAMLPFSALAGLPLASLVCTWSAGLLLLALRFVSSRRGQALVRLAVCALVVAAGSCLAIRARDPLLWRNALDFRLWVLPASVPLFGMAFLDRYLKTRPTVPRGPELPILHTVAAVFLVVLVAQSAAWLDLTRRLERSLSESPLACIPRSAVPWLGSTPLYHWGTPTYAILVQGRRPRKLLLEDEACRDLSHGIHLLKIGKDGGLYLRHSDRGWFDLTAAVRTALSQQGSQRPQ